MPTTKDTYTEKEAQKFTQLCLDNKWNEVLKRLTKTPSLARHEIPNSGNGKHTFALHLAIIGKGDAPTRKKIVNFIMDKTPDCVGRENSWSWPLHSLCSSAYRFDGKDAMILKMIAVCPEALTGVTALTGRTPLHMVKGEFS